jgi:hypothetical protein
LGYTRQRDGGTVDYHVRRPHWRVWRVADVDLQHDASAVGRADIGALLKSAPVSVFVADGSPVSVSLPRRMA